MQKRTIVLTAAFLGLIGAAAAQTAPAKADSPAIPRMPDGHPNLNGIWDHPYVPDVSKDGSNQKGAGPLPFTEWGAENFKNYDVSKFDYTGHCLPFGLMRSQNVGGYPIQIMQYGDYMAYLFEQSTWFHVIAMNRDHPKHLEPTWFGDSVGKWDGDTLVVDTIGMNGKTRIDTIGHPDSDQMHIIERISFIDRDHLNYEVTVEDPKTYTKPWKNTRTYWRMKPGEELIEYSCEENNRDLTLGHIK
ncbi:MAG TPA: hypothetical protein VK789_05475 [Bryobacteraceae bacterium]|jgi:hypothetical protein|nr:hypothetical protein [Bryobacteraceae bacterium]